MKLKALAISVGTALAVSNAIAGECPADKRVPDGQGQKDGEPCRERSASTGRCAC